MSGVEGSGRAEARFSTLLLNLALKRRDLFGVVEQDVRCLKHRIIEQRDGCPLAVLASLVLPLRHAVEPAHPSGAVQDPA